MCCVSLCHMLVFLCRLCLAAVKICFLSVTESTALFKVVWMLKAFSELYEGLGLPSIC